MTFKADILGKEHYPRTNVFISGHVEFFLLNYIMIWIGKKEKAPRLMPQL